MVLEHKKYGEKIWFLQNKIYLTVFSVFVIFSRFSPIDERT